MEHTTNNNQQDGAAAGGATVETTTPEDDFRVLIDESYFSLVYSKGQYVADFMVNQALHPTEQEAAMVEVLRRAREFGLSCFSSHPHSNGWITLQFYKVEDVIDSIN